MLTGSKLTFLPNALHSQRKSIPLVSASEGRGGVRLAQQNSRMHTHLRTHTHALFELFLDACMESTPLSLCRHGLIGSLTLRSRRKACC